MNKKSIIIAICILLFIGAFIGAFYEYKEVPDVKWNDTFDFEDEEPYGLYVFKEMAERYFGEDHVEVVKHTKDVVQDSSLIVDFTGDITLSTMSLDTLLSLASRGHDVFLIGEGIGYDLLDTLEADFSYEYHAMDSLMLRFGESSGLPDDTLLYTFQNEEFETSISYAVELYDIKYDITADHIVKVSDSLGLLVSIPFGKGTVYLQPIDAIFKNVGYHQDIAFEYTQRVFSLFDNKKIYLTSNPRIQSYDTHENPLQYIMSNKALKAAYFLSLFGLLIYAYFSGKRKQKVIPVIEKNENTSLEYIDTVSQLFYQQGQPEKLVRHMRDIFFHRMQKKFFIAPGEEDYIKKLAKKSKLQESELQFILDRFNNLKENYKFSEDQLERLNRRLEYVYDFINTSDKAPKK